MRSIATKMAAKAKVQLKLLDVFEDFNGAPVAQCIKRWPTDLADRV